MIRRQVLVTTHPWDPGAHVDLTRAYIDSIGRDHILFGSDWPHFGATVPDDIRRLVTATDLQQRILACNASSVFGSRLTA